MDRKDFIKQSVILSGGFVFPKNAPYSDDQLAMLSESPEVFAGVSATDIQKKLETICGSKLIGCAMNSKWLLAQTAAYIRQSTVQINKTSEPTSIPKIRAGIDFNPNSIRLQTINSRIILSGFSPTIVLLEDMPARRAYNKLQVLFDPTELKIDLDYSNNRLGLFLSNSLPKFHIPDIENTPSNPHLDQTVLNDNGITTADFLQNQKIILYSNNNLIQLLDGFIRSLPFPKLLEAMKTFRIDPPYQYTFSDDYIYISGSLGLSNDSCPCAGADGFRVTTDLTKTPAPRQTEADTTNAFTFQYKHSLTPTTQASDRVRPVNDIDTPDFAFYYPKTITFTPLVNNQLTPAISFGDEGSFLLFSWFYRASANIKSNFPVIVIDTAKRQLAVDAPFDIVGGAGVSLKVGCIYIPLLHSMVKGSIDPSKLVITPMLTFDTNGLALYAKPDYTAKVDVQFFDPPMVDVLLNLLMGSFGNNLIGKEMRKKINGLNIKLIDFPSLEIDEKFGWLYSTISGNDNMLVAFKRDDG